MRVPQEACKKPVFEVVFNFYRIKYLSDGPNVNCKTVQSTSESIPVNSGNFSKPPVPWYIQKTLKKPPKMRFLTFFSSNAVPVRVLQRYCRYLDPELELYPHNTHTLNP